MPTVSIIIPNYNGEEHLKVCLDSIDRQIYTDYEVIVVDNGSTDGSIRLLDSRKNPPILHRFTENKGFPAAVNYGIIHSKGKYIALLNNDIELDSKWLSLLVNALESDKSPGSVACKMKNYFDRDRIDAVGDVLTRAGNIIGRGYSEIDHGQYDASEYVFGACAGAGIYRREVFDSVGLFDEDYFAWFEDADHHFRSQLKGYRSLYVPTAVCFHKRGATAKKMSDLSIRLHARNHLFYLIINLPAPMFWMNFPPIIGSRIRNWWTIIRQGNGSALIWAIGKVLSVLPKLTAKRKRVQRTRTVSIDYLQSLYYN